MIVYPYYRTLLSDNHIFIAGSTGSGKSVLLNMLIYNIMSWSNSERQMILIDPKRVELNLYKNSPHVIGYASEESCAITLLNKAYAIIEKRTLAMQSQGIKNYEGAYVYVIIDELADLLTSIRGKEVKLLVQRIAQLGRAAKVILIACTQAPSRKLCSAELLLNFNTRIALHCNSRIESVQIINQSGAESLPLFGNAIVSTPQKIEQINVPFLPIETLKERVNYWQRTHKKLFR